MFSTSSRPSGSTASTDSLFEEGIEVIRRAFEKGRTGYEGKRWRFEDLPFGPRPQRPPPIYIGAFADPAIDRAARLADGFLASTGGGALADTYRRVRDALARHGRADEEVPFVASGVLYVHEDSERARADVAPAISYQRSRYEWGTDRDGRARTDPARGSAVGGYLVGNPDEVAEGLISLYKWLRTTTSASGVACRASPTSRRCEVCVSSPPR